MSELTDLMAVYGAVDEAVVRDPDRRARVAELVPIYAEGGGGWYDDFRKWAMEKGADDPPFPPLDEALELHERLRAPALLARTRVDWGESLIASGDIPRAAVLDLDPDRVTYTPLADLSTATEKARRDAPAIAVCEV